MAIFERILGGTIFYDFWTQFQQYIFSEKRLIQLFTLQPIEIYNDVAELEIDTAKVQLAIRSTVENLMQRRIDRTIDLITFNRSAARKDAFVYDFEVVISARMLYEEVSRFFTHHFSGQVYPIETNKYYLTIGDFRFYSNGVKAGLSLPFVLDAKWGPFRRKLKGTAIFKGSINFQHPKYVIKTRNLDYELETESWMLRIIDTLYHADLLRFLQDFLQYDFKEELFNAKVEAQLQINSLQDQSGWVSGNITDFDLDRITLDEDAVHAIFLAKGKIHIIR